MNYNRNCSSDQNDLKDALTHTLPIMAGYVFLSFVFGLLMRASGYPVWLPIAMSLFVYSGALEFAAVPIFASAFNPVSTFIFGLMLSARHLFYGIPLLKKYQHTNTAKPFLIFGLTDEIFSIVVTSRAPGYEKSRSKSYYTYVTLLGYLYWNIGTLIGVLLGGMIKINLAGLDFTLTALFIVLFLEQIKSKDGKFSGVIGILASIIALVVFGKESMVIASMGLILLALLTGKRVFDHE